MLTFDGGSKWERQSLQEQQKTSMEKVSLQQAIPHFTLATLLSNVFVQVGTAGRVSFLYLRDHANDTTAA